MKPIFYLMMVLALMACGEEEKTDTQAPVIKSLKLSSTSFDSGAAIPDKYTCVNTGQVFPNLSWNTTGKSYKSFVVIMDDPDAVPVAGFVWNHWLLYDIPEGTTSISEGSSTIAPLPAGTKIGQTSFGNAAYGGPCPPSGQLHHYIIRLYGLDVASLNLNAGSDVASVRAAMKGHISDSATYSGTFQR